MASHAETLRLQLASGPALPRQLMEKMAISQPTLSRALAAMGPDVVRIGAARSIQYALRDSVRGLPDIAIHRVDAEGKVTPLGQLVPVRPQGFVMQQADGATVYSEGLPWWLLDMRPQGFLGRAFAARLATPLGLPPQLADWSDTQMLRALLLQGQDAVGNLLLGNGARERLLDAPVPAPIAASAKEAAYVQLAVEAASGGLPGSSAGGEQPKFAAFAQTPAGPRHVLVKFTLPEANPVTERWRDLLLAEHHALETLAASGVAAARSCVVDAGNGQRFLEVERFDRVGGTGRRAVFSLASLDAEFVGNARAPWPDIVARLASEGHATREAAGGAALLFAFGTLIGNTDMHHGNLSFTSANGQRPLALAPAYDMLPMGFAPQASGGMADALAPARLHPAVGTGAWVQAADLARIFLDRVRGEPRFSAGFGRCIDNLARHIADAGGKIGRLG